MANEKPWHLLLDQRKVLRRELTMERLNRMEELGFKLRGEAFRETKTYKHIQGKKRRLRHHWEAEL